MFTLICGLPNSGKTTYSNKFDNVIHIDEIPVINKSPIKTVIELLNTTDDICVEGVFPIVSDRKKLIDAYKGKNTKCIWLNTPYEECVKRENRGRKEVLIKNCHSIFEPPTYEEGWDKIIIIGDNNG